jgi:hypothetical protein
MKKAITLILPFWVSVTNAQTTPQPFHFSVVQSVGADGIDSKNRDYRFSLYLFSGTVDSIEGVELDTLLNQNEGGMTGFKSSPLIHLTKGTVTGSQTAGLTDVLGDVRGFQNGGLSNHPRNIEGVQAAGLAYTA